MHGLPAGEVDLLHISHVCLPHDLDTAGRAHDGMLSEGELVWLTPRAHSRSAPPGCSFHVRQPETRRPRCCRLPLLNQAAQGSSSRWSRPKAVPPLRQLLLLLFKLRQAMAACLRWGPTTNSSCMYNGLRAVAACLTQPHWMCLKLPLIPPMPDTRITQWDAVCHPAPCS